MLEQNKKEALALYKDISTFFGEADLKPDEFLTQIHQFAQVCKKIKMLLCYHILFTTIYESIYEFFFLTQIIYIHTHTHICDTYTYTHTHICDTYTCICICTVRAGEQAIVWAVCIYMSVFTKTYTFVSSCCYMHAAAICMHAAHAAVHTAHTSMHA